MNTLLPHYLKCNKLCINIVYNVHTIALLTHSRFDKRQNYMINIIYKLYIWILYTLLPCCYSILQYNITASHTAWMMLRVPQVWSCIISFTRSWTTLSCVRYWRFLRWSRTWMSRPVPPVSQQTCSPSSRLHPAPIRGNADTGKHKWMKSWRRYDRSGWKQA